MKEEKKKSVVIEFNDDHGDTIKNQKARRFEQFRQKREADEAIRKQRA